MSGRRLYRTSSACGRRSFGVVSTTRRMRIEQVARQHENLGQELQERRHRRALAPDHRDAPARRMAAEFDQTDVRECATGGFTASVGSSVTPTFAATIWRSVSRLVARKPVFSLGAGELAYLERLIAQAMAVFEQQQALIGEIVELELFARASGGVPARRAGKVPRTGIADAADRHGSAARARRHRGGPRAAGFSTISVFSSTSNSSRRGKRSRIFGTTCGRR